MWVFTCGRSATPTREHCSCIRAICAPDIEIDVQGRGVELERSLRAFFAIHSISTAMPRACAVDGGASQKRRHKVRGVHLVHCGEALISRRYTFCTDDVSESDPPPGELPEFSNTRFVSDYIS